MLSRRQETGGRKQGLYEAPRISLRPSRLNQMRFRPPQGGHSSPASCLLPPVSSHERNALAGSALVARRAGSAEAARATIASVVPMTMYVVGSVGSMPYKSPSSTRASASE